VRGRDLAGAVAEAQERIAKQREAADRLSHRMGRRVRGWLQQAQGAACGHRADQPALIMVLLYGLFNSLRDSLLALPAFRSRSAAALSRSISPAWISASRRDRIHLAVRRLGDERHPDHHLLQRGQPAGMAPIEAMFHAAEQRMRPMLMTALSACIGCCRRRSRPASAARCSGRWRPCRRRHADRTDHAARGRAGAADAKFDASVGRQNAVQSNTNPTLNSATLSHGAINGTAFARPGFVPAAIGGPRKVFAGISGNMIRPKY
jgi:hypothetical protein